MQAESADPGRQYIADSAPHYSLARFVAPRYSRGVGQTSPDSHGVNVLDRIESWAAENPRAAAIAFTLYLIVALLVCGTMDYNA